MQIEYIARKVELTDQVRQLTEKKLAKLMKYFNDVLDIRVELAQQRHLVAASIAIKGKDFDIMSTGQAKEPMTAVQEAVDKLEIQARRAKTRLKGRKRQGEEAAPVPDWNLDVLEADSLGAGEPRIVKTSSITIKPMTIDEAVLQLEKSRNEFIVFLNAGSSKVNVLYRRRDNNLGLITPEF